MSCKCGMVISQKGNLFTYNGNCRICEKNVNNLCKKIGYCEVDTYKNQERLRNLSDRPDYNAKSVEQFNNAYDNMNEQNKLNYAEKIDYNRYADMMKSTVQAEAVSDIKLETRVFAFEEEVKELKAYIKDQFDGTNKMNARVQFLFDKYCDNQEVATSRTADSVAAPTEEVTVPCMSGLDMDVYKIINNMELLFVSNSYQALDADVKLQVYGLLKYALSLMVK